MANKKGYCAVWVRPDTYERVNDYKHELEADTGGHFSHEATLNKILQKAGM